MEIKPLFFSYENITIEKYLEKCGVANISEYLKGGFNAIESPNKYENIDKGYEVLFGKVGDANV